jgi:putative methionine-R-sulfoxide reductase with GAF domain
MPIVMNNVLGQIRMTAAGSDDRAVRAKRLAEMIRKLGEYRWVGVYDVDDENVSIIGWSGPGADVRSDPRYLATLGDTLSEIIVPVLDPSGERVIGTVDVESERANTFAASDQRMIEQCAQAALPLWLLR